MYEILWVVITCLKMGGGGGWWVSENVSLGTRVAVCTLLYTYAHACILMQLMGRIIRLLACTQSDYVQKLNAKNFLVIMKAILLSTFCLQSFTCSPCNQLYFSCFWLADILSHTNARSVCTWTLWIWRELGECQLVTCFTICSGRRSTDLIERINQGIFYLCLCRFWCFKIAPKILKVNFSLGKVCVGMCRDWDIQWNSRKIKCKLIISNLITEL